LQLDLWYGILDLLHCRDGLTRFLVDAAGLFKYCGNNVWTCGCDNLLSSCTCENSADAGSGVNFTMPAPSALSSIASLDGDVAVPYSTSYSTTIVSASSASATSTSVSASVLPSSTAVAKGSNNTVKIGAGVGVSLGVLLLVAIAIAIFFWRKGSNFAPAEAPQAYQGNTNERRTGYTLAELQGDTSSGVYMPKELRRNNEL